MDILCLKSITLGDAVMDGDLVKACVTLRHLDGREAGFDFQIHYPSNAEPQYLSLYRLAMAMPLMNYGLFTEDIVLDFPVSKADRELLDDFLDVFAKDIFVNKLARRRTKTLKEECLPLDEDVTEENASPRARISVTNILDDEAMPFNPKENACGILSSGGKEALLTYSLLKELGAEVNPLYVNESGGHWRTALTAYRWHAGTEPNTARVWTNVDRFYNFMLDNLRIVKANHRQMQADTYPLRLCIFPVYVFMLLPVFAKRGIGNLLIGSEFDDPRSDWTYKGINHYFGIYDQHQDFDLRMEQWYSGRMKGMRQWSAVRPVTGLVVERVLTSRYPEAAVNQRSCHSCSSEGDNIRQCGKCTKCLGVMLFLKAIGADPTVTGFDEEDVKRFPANLSRTPLRLDPEELEHAKHLTYGIGLPVDGEIHPHVEGIHRHPECCDLGLIPARFRDGLMDILRDYTNGTWTLDNGTWIKED